MGTDDRSDSRCCCDADDEVAIGGLVEAAGSRCGRLESRSDGGGSRPSAGRFRASRSLSRAEELSPLTPPLGAAVVAGAPSLTARRASLSFLSFSFRRALDSNSCHSPSMSLSLGS